jgi:predicted glycoside hydrolase/deacetylase ChbG (UPF0249 family)
MGWHPNLNLDAPLLSPAQVPSLVMGEGQLASLGQMMLRMACGRLQYREVVRELDAQLQRFHDLVGHPPRLINAHKHVHVFPMISRALTDVLRRWRLRPYVRRVIEPPSCLRAIPGARIKRLFLATLGRSAARRQDRAGFTGNEWLAGVTDPQWVHEPQFFSRWIAQVPCRVVELSVHPGHRDETLIGRDCSATDGQLERRVAEHRLLTHPSFRTACLQAGFTLSSALQPIQRTRGYFHAAA